MADEEFTFIAKMPCVYFDGTMFGRRAQGRLRKCLGWVRGLDYLCCLVCGLWYSKSPRGHDDDTRTRRDCSKSSPSRSNAAILGFDKDVCKSGMVGRACAHGRWLDDCAAKNEAAYRTLNALKRNYLDTLPYYTTQLHTNSSLHDRLR
jgi:hypothetical protein